MGGVIAYKSVNYVVRQGNKINALNQQIVILEDKMALMEQQSKNEQQYSYHINDTLRILLLGNSITRHRYNADLEWYSDWGMAASKPEKDYKHQLQKMVEAVGYKCKVENIRFSTWERNLDINIVLENDSIINCSDIIVVRIGENVIDTEHFEEATDELMSYLTSKNKQLIVTGCFWVSLEKESVLVKAARKYNATFVSLDWIAERYDVYPQIGDTIYNIHNEPYIVTKDFIRLHPNDLGMKMIATEIFNHIQL